MKRLSASILAVIALSAANAGWVDVRSPEMKVAIDFDCASGDTFPAAVLRAAARDAAEPLGGTGVRTWADRAFGYDLNNDARPEYFVPLVCGATGNCTWAVFAVGPPRLLGRVEGARLYIHEPGAPWSRITGLSTSGASGGLVTRYAFDGQRYGELDAKELDGAELERFIARAVKPDCARRPAA